MVGYCLCITVVTLLLIFSSVLIIRWVPRQSGKNYPISTPSALWGLLEIRSSWLAHKGPLSWGYWFAHESHLFMVRAEKTNWGEETSCCGRQKSTTSRSQGAGTDHDEPELVERRLGSLLQVQQDLPTSVIVMTQPMLIILRVRAVHFYNCCVVVTVL